MTLCKNARSSGFDMLTAYGIAVRRTIRVVVQHGKEKIVMIEIRKSSDKPFDEVAAPAGKWASTRTRIRARMGVGWFHRSGEGHCEVRAPVNGEIVPKATARQSDRAG